MSKSIVSYPPSDICEDSVRMSYDELALSRRISAASAKRLVRRQKWQKSYGNDGTVRVLVPADEAAPNGLFQNDKYGRTGTDSSSPDISEVIREAIHPLTILLGEQLARANHRNDVLEVQLADAQAAAERIGADSHPLTAIGIQTLSQAVEMLREDLAIANSSLLAEHERAETERQDARRWIDGLQRRIDGVYADLADARTAAMISGSEAATLRHEIEKSREWSVFRRLRWALSGGRRQ